MIGTTRVYIVEAGASTLNVKHLVAFIGTLSAYIIRLPDLFIYLLFTNEMIYITYKKLPNKIFNYVIVSLMCLFGFIPFKKSDLNPIYLI